MVLLCTPVYTEQQRRKYNHNGHTTRSEGMDVKYDHSPEEVREWWFFRFEV